MIFSKKLMFCCILSSGTLKSSIERFALACLAILQIEELILGHATKRQFIDSRTNNLDLCVEKYAAKER